MHFPELRLALPLPSFNFLDRLPKALAYLPLTIPFALATVVGGVDVTESAAAAGDDYNTRDILLVEGFTTLMAGLCGGVIQSTPYIGHPAYKDMGGRSDYTLATALFIRFSWRPCRKPPSPRSSSLSESRSRLMPSKRRRLSIIARWPWHFCRS